jgi:glycosyltransferase involved in cell wall biosynthesis
LPPVPEFSAVIPAFNASSWIAEAIDSALAQRGHELEVVVVDDGSTDDTAAIVSRFGSRVSLQTQRNRGVASARNHGARLARGRYLAFLDADDAWAPEKLLRQAQALAAQPEAQLSYTAFRVVDEDGRETEQRGGGPAERILERLLLEGNVVGTPSSVACERQLFLDSGGFDVSLSQCADWELWIRLALRTPFARVAEALVTYRRHSMSMSRDVGLLEGDSLRTLGKAFDEPALPPALRERRREAYGRLYLVLAGSYFQAGRYRAFARCAVRCLQTQPKNLGYMAAFPVRWWLRR